MDPNIGIGISTMVASWLISQAPTPTDPPAFLPPAVTGQSTTPPPATITPVSSPIPAKTRTPIERFDPQTYPAETMQCVYGIRMGSDWLGKVHQANGRVMPGINPTLAAVWANDSEAKQALALVGLCQSARMTGDAGLTAKASQSLLQVISGLKPDPMEANRVVLTCPEAEKATVAACLVLATAELPNADARMLAISEHMALYLRTARETDPFARALSMRALVTSDRMKPADWKREAAMSAMSAALAELKTKFNAILASGVVIAASDLYLATKDAKFAAIVAEQTDLLCAKQYDRTKVQGGFTWAGAVKITDADDAEPTFNQTIVATALVAATQVTRQTADLVRYSKYRTAAVESLMFVRGLQMTPDTSSHFESGFRTRSVVGGVRATVTDPILRSDATALAIGAFVRFVESGCEKRE